jgi:hypothetical protein
MLIKAAIFVAVCVAGYLGVRRISRDWLSEVLAVDTILLQRDLRERQRPDVITLERDKDGTYRPPDEPRR